MNIALINQPWNTVDLPVRRGSIAIWNYQTARRLAAFCDVAVFAQLKGSQARREVFESVQYQRVPMAWDRRMAGVLGPLRWLWKARRPLFASPLHYGRYIDQVARLLPEGCQIVHLHNMTQFVPALRRRAPQAKIILHMHSEWLSQLDRQLVANRIGQCDMIIGCSDYIIDLVRERFPEAASRCRTLHNGVDVLAFSPLEGQAAPEDQVLYVGRISPEKGVHDLMEAFRLVRRERPGAKLTVVGPDTCAPSDFIVSLSKDKHVTDLKRFYKGDYLARVRSMLGSDMKDCVTFVGHVDHDKLPDYYRRASVLVTPSLSESFGMSLIEAMACGIPVVATAVGGMTDVVEPGRTGLLCPPAQPAKLAQAILQVLTSRNRARQMGLAGRIAAVDRFSWESIASQTLQCYQELCGDDMRSCAA